MTPLAHEIAKQAMLKAQKRVPVYSGDTKQIIEPETVVDDIHCFECTEVFELACELADSGRLKDVLDERIFLPAPNTWIEHKDAKGRHAWLLIEKPLTLRVITRHDGRYLVKTIDLDDRSEDVHGFIGIVLAMLAIINAPHIVYRESFRPHKRIERMWARRLRKVPLNAWHELKLRVNKPIEIEDGEPHSEQIGGQRALHFCRAHLRIRLGRLEFVTSHWRGDPALGTKLTRYRVAQG